ncbi:MAG: CoA transferase [Leptospiraceae bacterium]|nr:CoA transferase [Leptospiraceae bacterium]
MKILEGLLVVSLEQAVAAPFASSRLADSGARVIKVERPSEGDFARYYDHVVNGESAYFVWINRGKESVFLDIKNSEDNSFLKKLISHADVFIQNLAPGAAARSGFDSLKLREEKPSLITCDITGYGETGPCKDMKAYDNLLQGETGLLSITGDGEVKAKAGISVCDISAGMYAYTSILEALILRQKTGQGSSIKISLFDCMADWMSVPLLHQIYAGKPPSRTGMHHASIAPYGPYKDRNGKEVLISIQNEREFKKFWDEVLEKKDSPEYKQFENNSLRVASRDALNRIIDGVFGNLPMESIIEKLENSSIAYGRVNSVEEFSKHPHLRMTEVETSSGMAKLVERPALFVGLEQNKFGKVPSPGENTEAIKKEFL